MDKVGQDEGFGNGQETVVALGVEVGVVADAFVLEIDGAESVALGEDVAAACGVENGNGVLSAYIDCGVDNLAEVVVVETIAVPACEKQYVGSRISVDESAAKLAKAQAVVVDSD